jgi:hypothetical protein
MNIFFKFVNTILICDLFINPQIIYFMKKIN